MADNLDTYDIPETGETIFTAHFLSKKNRCCKSTCLHCPYGHTLSKIKIEFKPFNLDWSVLEKTLIENEYNKPQNIADQLMACNLGAKRKQIDVRAVNPIDIQLMFLKGYFMGFVFIEANKIKQFFLAKQFQFQGIEKHTIEEHFII